MELNFAAILLGLEPDSLYPQELLNLLLVVACERRPPTTARILPRFLLEDLADPITHSNRGLPTLAPHDTSSTSIQFVALIQSDQYSNETTDLGLKPFPA